MPWSDRCCPDSDWAPKSEPQKNKLKIRIWCDDDYCILQVSDRGPGVKLSYGTKSDEDSDGRMLEELSPGRGVGLAAVRLIAQVHCGSFSIGGRKDGISGTVAEMRWNQSQLRQEYADDEGFKFLADMVNTKITWGSERVTSIGSPTPPTFDPKNPLPPGFVFPF